MYEFNFCMISTFASFLPFLYSWSNSYTIGGAPSHPNVPFDRLRNGRRVNGRGNNGGSGTLGSTRVGSSPSLLGSPRSVSTLPRANPRQIQQVGTLNDVPAGWPW